jgi:hypothetical protein
MATWAFRMCLLRRRVSAEVCGVLESGASLPHGEKHFWVECFARCEVWIECESKCWCFAYLGLVLVVQTASCRRMSKLCGGMQPSQSKCLAVDGDRPVSLNAGLAPTYCPLCSFLCSLRSRACLASPAHTLKHFTLPPRHSPRAYYTARPIVRTTPRVPPGALRRKPSTVALPPPKQQPYSSLLDILFIQPSLAPPPLPRRRCSALHALPRPWLYILPNLGTALNGKCLWAVDEHLQS